MKMGFSYEEILAFLHLCNGFSLSSRHLKRILKGRNLWRIKKHSDLNLVIDAVETELYSSGKDLGYRSMHDRITKEHHLVVSRETVRFILSNLDPEGVACRRQHRLRRRSYHAQGPDYLWHIDGWDKLKPYGLCVHGWIDGYSRNKDPFVICSYFVDSVKARNGLPTIVRADNGTENCNVQTLQSLMRTENKDSRGRLQTSFLENQLLTNGQSWWSKFGMLGMNTWLEHFRGIVTFGIINTAEKLDIECVLFCYIDLLRQELQTCLKLWNTHYIRKTRNDPTFGRPDVMYYLPQMCGGRSGVMPFNTDDLDILSNTLSSIV